MFAINASREEGRDLFTTWATVCDLEKEKGNLVRQLFDADDRLLGDSYDEQKVKSLERQILEIDGKVASLESDRNVITMREQQKRMSILLEREKLREDLTELSTTKSLLSLRWAVIISSNEICSDCDLFRTKVNEFFQLTIGMYFVQTKEPTRPGHERR